MHINDFAAIPPGENSDNLSRQDFLIGHRPNASSDSDVGSGGFRLGLGSLSGWLKPLDKHLMSRSIIKEELFHGAVGEAWLAIWNWCSAGCRCPTILHGRERGCDIAMIYGTGL
ncbi:hypothetical protein F1880_001177 [Penicillium rolfsii]|nr:hypothetical protein F1880_001177 [Penicillium rolfsii]